MNKLFKITIPKPCHEDWNTMTPNEKGRFCNSCAKTVVDFTQKSPKEIQDYLIENKNQRVCGHFKRKQLDSIVIQIPESTFYHQLSFQKLFVLSLLLIMGTTLFSCKTDTGKNQKIEKVEIVDSVFTEKIMDSLTYFNSKDSLKGYTTFCPSREDKDEKVELEGEVDFKSTIKESEMIDGIVELGKIKLEKNVPYNFYGVDEVIRFKRDKNLKEKEAKKVFEKRIKEFIKENFDVNLTKNLGLSSGKYRIFAQLIISETGTITEIRVRAPHLKLKKHSEEIIGKLPQFIPAKKEGENVCVKYTLPITIKVD
ncbi:hypothetical protein [Tenacibaculum sp. 190524A02b]|uniref:hypothetical protein n=1 Tax=Tenacibaculum vairaonense TaxID=3137860 RepID=UPI0032B1150F